MWETPPVGGGRCGGTRLSPSERGVWDGATHQDAGATENAERVENGSEAAFPYFAAGVYGPCLFQIPSPASCNLLGCSRQRLYRRPPLSPTAREVKPRLLSRGSLHKDGGAKSADFLRNFKPWLPAGPLPRFPTTCHGKLLQVIPCTCYRPDDWDQRFGRSTLGAGSANSANASLPR